VKRKRFSVEQITSVLQQVTGGMAVGDVCRQVGISEQTFYRWKKTYGGMLPSEARSASAMRVPIAE
jgi:putative transposase